MERHSFPVFEESDFWLDISAVTIGPQIGEGQFSRVYIGKYFGDYVAVKKQTRQDKVLDCYLLRELAVLKNASHENLVGYIGACNEVATNKSKINALYIVTEFCQGGDLLGLLQSTHPLGWKFRIKIALNVASALKYLHRHNLIHRDIKSSNMLLDHNWTCKLSDFGMARELINDGAGERNSMSKRMTICGTNEYMAPELLFDEEYGSAVDIYSFGMVLLEIMKRQQVGKNDFASRRPQTGFNLDRDAVSAQLPSDSPSSLTLLSLQCCEYEASNRPFADDVQDWLADLYHTFPDDTIPLPPMNPLVVFGEEKTPIPPAPTPTLPTSSPAPAPVALDTTKEAIPDNIRDLYASSDGTAKTILKAGYIWKKNNTGFRNWKFRWMVLTPFQLKWYANMNDRYEKGHLDLLDTRVKKTKQYRFVVLDAKEEMELENHDSTNYHREFSADGQESMEDWIQAIQAAIDNYRRLRVTSRTSIAAPLSIPISLPNQRADPPQYKPDLFSQNPSNVEEWLTAIHLSQYHPNFQRCGYTNLQMIYEFGLQNDDLDFLGITHPLHRRTFSICALAEYSETITTAIPEWEEVGSVVVYRVTARWRFARSDVLLQYGDFKKLHSNILRTLTGPECTKLLSKLPALPGKQLMVLNSRNAAFLNERRQALEDYLVSLSNLMAGTPMMKILLEAIGLTAKTIDKADKKEVVNPDNFSHTRKEEIEL